METPQRRPVVKQELSETAAKKSLVVLNKGSHPNVRPGS